MHYVKLCFVRQLYSFIALNCNMFDCGWYLYISTHTGKWDIFKNSLLHFYTTHLIQVHVFQVSNAIHYSVMHKTKLYIWHYSLFQLNADSPHTNQDSYKLWYQSWITAKVITACTKLSNNSKPKLIDANSQDYVSITSLYSVVWMAVMPLCELLVACLRVA